MIGGQDVAGFQRLHEIEFPCECVASSLFAQSEFPYILLDESGLGLAFQRVLSGGMPEGIGHDGILRRYDASGCQDLGDFLIRQVPAPIMVRSSSVVCQLMNLAG